MRSNAHIPLNSPLEEWPLDWDTLLRDLNTHELTENVWKTLVATHVTLAPMKDDTEAAYKAYFHQFWTEVMPLKAANNPQWIMKAAKNGCDVYITKQLSTLIPEERRSLSNLRMTPGNTDTDTALHVAVDRHHLLTVIALLDNGAEKNASGNLSETPLHRAANNGFVDIINALLVRGASREERNSNNEQPIHVAVIADKANAVEALLSYEGGKTQLLATGREGRTAFYQAALLARNDVMAVLLKHGSDPNEFNLHEQSTALHVAAVKDNVAAVKLLLQYDADANVRDGSGLTPLQRCALYTSRHKQPSLAVAEVLIEALIKKEVNINAGDPSPLDLLASHPLQQLPKILTFATLLIGASKAPNVVNLESALALLQAHEHKLKEDERGLYNYLKGELAHTHQPSASASASLGK